MKQQSIHILVPSALLVSLSLMGCNLHRADRDTGSNSEPQSTSTSEASGLMGPQARDTSPIGDNQPAARSVEEAKKNLKSSLSHGPNGPVRVVNGSSGDSFSTTGRSFEESAENVKGTVNKVGAKADQKAAELARKMRNAKNELVTKTGMRYVEIKDGDEVVAYKIVAIPADTSPETMGLKVGDVITEINGRPVRETEVGLDGLQMGSDMGYVMVSRGGKTMRLPEGVLSGTSRPQ